MLTADTAGFSDNGEPIRCTPYDFRRLFTAELVGLGLPIHIAATSTSRGYTAVLPEQATARWSDTDADCAPRRSGPPAPTC